MTKTTKLLSALIFAGILALGTSGCGRQDSGKPAVKAAVLSAPLPRDKFMELTGKSEEQVLEQVGKADEHGHQLGLPEEIRRPGHGQGGRLCDPGVQKRRGGTGHLQVTGAPIWRT
jgi:hypothetical protein